MTHPTSKYRLIWHLQQHHGFITYGLSKRNLQWLHGEMRAQKECGWHD
jgi:hypothetical protein